MMLNARQKDRTARTPTLPPTAPAKVAMLCFFFCLEVMKHQMISVNRGIQMIQCMDKRKGKGLAIQFPDNVTELKRTRQHSRLVSLADLALYHWMHLRSACRSCSRIRIRSQRRRPLEEHGGFPIDWFVQRRSRGGRIQMLIGSRYGRNCPANYCQG
jgi:hypothetical protein